MGSWLILIIIVLIILIVWWALLRNVKNYKPDFEAHGHEEHAEAPHMETAAVEMRASEIAPMTTAGVYEQPAVAEPVMPEPTVVEPVMEEPILETPLRAPEMPATITDDLTIIEGIGPVINKLLHNHGIGTFAELAEADADRLREILVPAGLRFIDPATWPKQARLAAEGKMDELREFTDKLRGGREVN